MSLKNLGTNYTCDLCSRVENSDRGLPYRWQEAKLTYKNECFQDLHSCGDCWSHPTKNGKKLMQRIKDRFTRLRAGT